MANRRATMESELPTSPKSVFILDSRLATAKAFAMDGDRNPFAAPTAVPDTTRDVRGEFELAGRLIRLGTCIVDTLISLVWSVPMIIAFGIGEKAMRGESVRMETLGVTAVSTPFCLAVNGYFLATNDQTLRKKLRGIRIADMSGVNPGLAKIFFARMLLVTVAVSIPVAGNVLPLLDVLFIFGASRCCIHDLIAGTQGLKV